MTIGMFIGLKKISIKIAKKSYYLVIKKVIIKEVGLGVLLGKNGGVTSQFHRCIS